MDVLLLVVPYDSGVRDVRMGVGPGHLLESGLADHLIEAGHRVEIQIVDEPVDRLTPEPKTAFALNSNLARRVGAAREDGLFPLVLAGNCYTAIGTVAALGSRRTAVLWFDSHADFNTPDTTVTGFLDGMGLAALAGRCWTHLAASVPGLEPVPERHMRLLGVRDLDPLEAELLESSDVRSLPPEELRAELDGSLALLEGAVDLAYVHIDLDVLDPSEGRANILAAPGGLTLPDTLDAVSAIGRRFPIGGAALTAYDPSFDEDGRVSRAAFRLAAAILEAASGSP